MDHVEFVRDVPDAFEHPGENGVPVDGRCPGQRSIADRHQFGGGDRIAAGKQGHVVTLPHQFFRQVGDDPFGAPVELRRHALTQRSNLGNFHQHNLLNMSEAMTMKTRGRTAPRVRFIYERLHRVQYLVAPQSIEIRPLERSKQSSLNRSV